MPYFHATAVFEARGAFAEEADRAAAALLKTLRHPRIQYYEHETSGGAGPYRPAGPLYFTVVADFDVEAPGEEGAADMIEDVLDSLSTDTIQYCAHGITAGERRVRPEQRVAPAPEQESEREARSEQEERGGRKRGSRSRGRRRGGVREAESPREEEPTTPLSSSPQAGSAQLPAQIETVPLATPVEEETGAETRTQERKQPAPVTYAEVEAPLPPPRSSAAMRVTLAVTLRASELPRPTNGSVFPDQQELIHLATAEARRRHPELPEEISPECKIVSLPWGEVVLTLTWHYHVPVPSAADTA